MHNCVLCCVVLCCVVLCVHACVCRAGSCLVPPQDRWTNERVEEAAFASSASDYSTIFMPWGPKWDSRRITKMVGVPPPPSTVYVCDLHGASTLTLDLFLAPVPARLRLRFLCRCS